MLVGGSGVAVGVGVAPDTDLVMLKVSKTAPVLSIACRVRVSPEITTDVYW